MAIKWRLKSYLAQKYFIYTATEFRKKIIQETGIIISLQNVCNYINADPKMIRLSTLEVICTALKCDLNEFFQVGPSIIKKKQNKKLSYKNAPISKRSTKNFPDPKDYKK